MTADNRDDEMRTRVRAAYDDVLREPVPDRLKRLLDAPAPVVHLAAERARRRAATRQPRWTWMHWGGMAASVLVGVAVGMQWAARQDDGLIAENKGEMVAGEKLARALDTRLAGEGGDVRVQVSFVDRAGRYCRTFAAEHVAGLACRDAARWTVVGTARADAVSAEGMRPAATGIPRPVLDAVDARIAGNALDARQERAARDRGWRKAQ